ncbi:MAG: helix-hairpin-helix domain-containing protein [Mariniphaga sp.]
MRIRWLRDLFNYSGKERTGIIVLLVIIFILLLIGWLIPRFIPADQNDFTKWQAEVSDYLAKKETVIPVAIALHTVAFNPNEVDSVSLANMGLPLKLRNNWLKYLEKGGYFRDKEGVKKIFGMTSELFDQLDNFIVIPAKSFSVVKIAKAASASKPANGFNRDTIFKHAYLKKEKQKVTAQELNSTDSLHLLEIPGIGPVFASRIIRYRNLLGGYYSVSQLKEVYGMREETFNAVEPFFVVDPAMLKSFNINFSTVQEMGRHPYFGFKTARKVVKLRDKTGKISSPDDLSSVITTDSLNKLIPYLKFSE